MARLCLALDSRDEKEIVRLAEATAEHVDVIKIGLTAFNSQGAGLVRRLLEMRPVFLDLKLHDIPAQVSGAIAAVGDIGATYTTVHAFGGPAMLTAAVEAAPEDLTILAVTVLTSLDDGDLSGFGIADDAEKTVLRLADLALSCGIPGLVCSPREVGGIRERYGPAPDGPLLMVPGIRPADDDAGDQRRTLGPSEAARAGADILVVGRPITAASDPAAAARSIKEEIVERG
jgi:orotidine-5'-phosphate decarboxylase